jgi:hypothetical protein
MPQVLRCTAKYRKLMGLPNALKEPPPSTSALGPWFANPLNVGRQRYLHFLSQASLLSVLIPLRERTTAEQRLQRTLRELLSALVVPPRLVEAEVAGLDTPFYAKTNNRSTLGSMNDQAFIADYHLATEPVETLWEVMLRLSETPCGPMEYQSPRSVAPKLIWERWGRPRGL